MDIRPVEDNSKKVVALYQEGQIDEETMNDTLEAIDATVLKIEEIKIIPAVIPFPYEQVKAFVLNDLNKYKNIVVTEENLAWAESLQRKLGGYSKRFDDFRKDKKREASANITSFESDMNEIRDLILDVQSGIKKQTEIYEEKRKQEQKEKVAIWIHEVASDLGLTEKYEEMLAIQDKYLNKTQKDKDTKTDLSNRAQALLEMQKQEEELGKLRSQKEKLAESLCKTFSETLSLATPIELKDLGNLDEIELSNLSDHISKAAQDRKNLEEKALQKKEEAVPQKECVVREVSTHPEDDFCWYGYRLKLNANQKNEHDSWLKERGIDYEILP